MEGDEGILDRMNLNEQSKMMVTFQQALDKLKNNQNK